MPTGDPSMGLGHEPAPSPCSRASTSQPGGAGWGWEPQHHTQTGTTPGVRNPRHSWRAVPPWPHSPHGAQDGSELQCWATGLGMVLPVRRVWHGFASLEGLAWFCQSGGLRGRLWASGSWGARAIPFAFPTSSACSTHEQLAHATAACGADPGWGRRSVGSPILGRAFICFYFCCKWREPRGASASPGRMPWGHPAFLAQRGGGVPQAPRGSGTRFSPGDEPVSRLYGLS